jgi:hypothetical protein
LGIISRRLRPKNTCNITGEKRKCLMFCVEYCVDITKYKGGKYVLKLTGLGALKHKVSEKKI